jgi:hypothetical protein
MAEGALIGRLTEPTLPVFTGANAFVYTTRVEELQNE